MKKLLVLCLLLVGIGFGAGSASAEVYVGDTDNIKIDEASNKEAIRMLTDSGEIDEIAFPLDKIAAEPPMESIDNFGMLRKLPRYYYYNESKYVFGMYQLRSAELAPAGFKWLDNGIPTSCTTVRIPGKSGSFAFKSNVVSDAGISAYDAGFYWRKFNTPSGSFWASVSSLNRLIYG